jgi:7-cyano-7-deazaguanine reductase
LLADCYPTLLETFVNKHQNRDYMVTFKCPEFTTLCPKTGPPDFGCIYINCIPDVRMVESKSLKLYSSASASTETSMRTS